MQSNNLVTTEEEVRTGTTTVSAAESNGSLQSQSALEAADLAGAPSYVKGSQGQVVTKSGSATGPSKRFAVTVPVESRRTSSLDVIAPSSGSNLASEDEIIVFKKRTSVSEGYTVGSIEGVISGLAGNSISDNDMQRLEPLNDILSSVSRAEVDYTSYNSVATSKRRLSSSQSSSAVPSARLHLSSRNRSRTAWPAKDSVDDELDGFSNGVDRDSQLLIKLYYNPVMDEWISLTESGASDAERRSRTADVLFDLNKKIVTDSQANGNNVRDVTDSILPDVEVVQVSHFLAALETTGIRRTDPRLKSMMSNLDAIHSQCYPGESFDALAFNRHFFKRMIGDNIDMLSRAFKNQFVIPEFVSFCDVIKDIYELCRTNTGGHVATYIPQLAKVDPDQFGISICTIDGQRFSIGQAQTPFTMQSSSKPFTYAVCLDQLGRDLVHRYVGQEPSGRVFNELTLDQNKKPHNPLLNSGAIMSAALLTYLVRPEMQTSEKFEFVAEKLKKIGGNEFVGFSNSIFLSERETADRNFALAYHMRENKSFPPGFSLHDCLDFYFQTCSLEINCETAAIMGATLAKGGKCPITDEEVLKPIAVRDVLSLMHSCGMYNYSGEFAFNVGLPAKSGVSGSLILVIPNVMGIGIWSPPLDVLGNTVRGVQFAKELVKRFNFHRFDSLVNQSTSRINPRLFYDEIEHQAVMSHLYAATTGDLISLKRFFYNHGADLSEPNYDGRTPLHLAAAEGHLSCVKFLVETCGLDILVKDRWDFSPLSEARRFDHQDVSDYLISCLTERHMQRMLLNAASPLDTIP